jgi:4-aminobutyrate aminotransferase-like enzyme
MIGVEFSTPGLAAKLMDDLREKGVIALPSGNTGATLSITPALNIPEYLMKSAIEVLAKVL